MSQEPKSTAMSADEASASLLQAMQVANEQSQLNDSERIEGKAVIEVDE